MSIIGLKTLLNDHKQLENSLYDLYAISSVLGLYC